MFQNIFNIFIEMLVPTCILDLFCAFNIVFEYLYIDIVVEYEFS